MYWNIAIVACLFNVSSCALLIPSHGIMGTCIALGDRYFCLEYLMYLVRVEAFWIFLPFLSPVRKTILEPAFVTIEYVNSSTFSGNQNEPGTITSAKLPPILAYTLLFLIFISTFRIFATLPWKFASVLVQLRGLFCCQFTTCLVCCLQFGIKNHHDWMYHGFLSWWIFRCLSGSCDLQATILLRNYGSEISFAVVVRDLADIASAQRLDHYSAGRTIFVIISLSLLICFFYFSFSL